ncbi:hypothetical protein B5C34_06650 [Pacificimonas flava]|uniref:DUF1178 family protein n=2 Tax=Pacificimonas TaxID=1960290 RepID=A0A219B459_9SPHN|nr:MULTISPECIES: DUF1178 family protein [Pacificimonas]MBZ6377098.1 DUF1178 family protein [Pacificimonas aurantium]OWV33172.1 hypothetical protein B5C34_06650 [Pacificimonas flava]
MIVFDLKCSASHVFEGWFSSAADFERQQEKGLVACPICEDVDVRRAPSALAIGSGRSAPAETTAGEQEKTKDASPAGTPPETPPVDPAAVKAALAALAKAQADAVAKSDYVGSRFAEEARSMHYGEQDHRPIYGETAPEEAKALREEGVDAMPLLFPVRPRSDA